MDEEEQFVNIDLNDDNICSVCKLETDTGTMSFCHVCFELTIEGVPTSALLHTKSLRGHRDCFEKYHLIADQTLSHPKASSRSAYEGVKLALGQKLSRIIRYAQNKDVDRGVGTKRLCHSQRGEPAPRSDAQVPRYTARWEAAGRKCGMPDYAVGMLECHAAEERGLIPARGQPRHGGRPAAGDERRHGCRRHRGHSRDELVQMNMDELHQLNAKLLLQIQKVFEELTATVQEKDSLASELHVRHVAIEQLFKNCAKLPWLHISRAAVKASSGTTPVE